MSDAPLINFINFNQNGSCISIATTEGFRIYNCDPFGKFYSQKKLNFNSTSNQDNPNMDLSTVSSPTGCSLAIVEMLYSTSLLAIVGLGDQPALSPRRLTMLNTKTDTVICEVTFPTAILSVKMNKARLIVVLREQIYIYDIKTMRLLHTIENNENDKGLIALSTSLDNDFLAYPSPPKIINSEIEANLTTNNMVLLSNNSRNNIQSSDNNRRLGKDANGSNEQQNLDSEPNNNEPDAPLFMSSNNLNNKNTHKIIKNGDVILFNLVTLQPTMVVEAHKGTIAALALNNEGTLLATASEKGTIVRVFSVETGAKLYQFRRGTYPTNVHSIIFSNDSKYLSVTCSSKTVHIFKMDNENLTPSNENFTSRSSSPPLSEELDNNSNETDMLSNETNTSPKSPDSSKKEPFVDTTRSTVGRMIRKSTQKFSKNAAKKFGEYFPLDVKSIIESSRHFASFKLPIESKETYSNYIGSNNANLSSHQLNSTSSESLAHVSMRINAGKYISSIGEEITLDLSNYPKVLANYSNYTTGQTSPKKITAIPIRVLSSDGIYYNYILDPERGGDCILISKYSLLLD
ncbi:hypothetical protein TPHA_0O01210 [Tetrapisispora phaffii CBS 4417]|uniref:Autophagy-related protein 18 n=1 Tax=Tetrapisispora phaffii (strain ATCC 24235 / CBS 4417 / NBRC 1672 / NRRL Y-8282 / UCD 70-5) TaxID=1071381 RepID=G8C1R2_TETPH|nr:hypothetical protein TPHA_0O01210 [Tetrapisispora phaffii CBS 4417]CCE66090.1 hypothetical protein TPHA_0O01210 [Tetrapisispora phaffii CBS 4417]